MRRPRLTIAWMLSIIAVIGVSLAVFRSGSDAALALIQNGVVFTLIYATFEARFAEQDQSAWWFGFAFVGWAHFFLNIISSSDQIPGTNWLLSQAFDVWCSYDINDSADQLMKSRRLFVCQNLINLLCGSVGGWGFVWSWI